MSFGLDESSLPQIGDAVAMALEQVQSYLETDDRQQARTALQEAEGDASTSDEYGAIAGVVLSDLGDEEWGRRVLSKAIERAPSATALASLAGHALQIGDMDLVHTIINRATDRATSVSDAMGAAAIAEVFGDDSAITKVFYNKAETLVSTSNDLITMSRGVAVMDPDRARRYLQQALDRLSTREDREAVAEVAEEVLDDGEWAERIRTEGMS